MERIRRPEDNPSFVGSVVPKQAKNMHWKCENRKNIVDDNGSNRHRHTTHTAKARCEATWFETNALLLWNPNFRYILITAHGTRTIFYWKSPDIVGTFAIKTEILFGKFMIEFEKYLLGRISRCLSNLPEMSKRMVFAVRLDLSACLSMHSLKAIHNFGLIYGFCRFRKHFGPARCRTRIWM